MNIFQLAYELQDIINTLEENGGEITPEIEEQLDINQEGVKHKVEAFTQVIHQLESDIEAIKNETKRLADLKKRKEATIESVKKLILYAIDMFGDTAKSGTKFIDFGTGKVSTRKSESIEVNTDAYEKLADEIKNIIYWAGFTNQPDSIDLTIANLLQELKKDRDKDEEGLTGRFGYESTPDDLNAATVNITMPIRLDVLNDERNKEIIECMAKHHTVIRVDVDVDKQYLKNAQKSENTHCKLSKLIQKTNVIIK